MRKILLMITALMLSVVSINAQSNNALLFATSRGDIWSWSSANLNQLTTWGYNDGVVLSPDGTRLAYLSWSADAVNNIASGNINSGDIAGNIWVMDIATEAFTRIAEQPAAPSEIYRSTPTWSPDGTQLAWTEVFQNYSSQIVIYDFATNSQRVLTDDFDLGFQDAGLFVPPVIWGAGGLSRLLFTFEGSNNGIRTILEVYDPVNGDLRTLDLTSGDNYANSHIWVKNQGQDQIAVVDSNGSWSVVDIGTGLRIPAHPPILRLLHSSESAVTLMPIRADNSWHWYADYDVTMDNTGYVSYGLSPHNLPAISPDGSAVAWNFEGNVTIENFQTGQQTILTGDTNYRPWKPSVVWAPLVWEIESNEGVRLCPNSPPTQFNAGVAGYVLPGDSNTIRSLPGTGNNSEVLGRIPANDEFLVIGNSRCGDDGRMWLNVIYNGIIGWTAEGDGNTYWLAPLANSEICTNSPTSRLYDGMMGYVLPGDPNVIREIPATGSSSAVLGEIPAIEEFIVIGTPVCGNEGRRWWFVYYNGIYGWTPEGEGNDYWLAPSTRG